MDCFSRQIIKAHLAQCGYCYRHTKLKMAFFSKITYRRANKRSKTATMRLYWIISLTIYYLQGMSRWDETRQKMDCFFPWLGVWWKCRQGEGRLGTLSFMITIWWRTMAVWQPFGTSSVNGFSWWRWFRIACCSMSSIIHGCHVYLQDTRGRFTVYYQHAWVSDPLYFVVPGAWNNARLPACLKKHRASHSQGPP